MQLGVVGINHKLAPLTLREQFTAVCHRYFRPGASLFCEASFLPLLTCNRAELYFSAESLAETHSHILSLLQREAGENLHQLLYSYFQADAFCHLSKVTSGLDSQIVGETEIQGQVKRAYEEARLEVALPRDMHYAFQKSLRIGKAIRNQFRLDSAHTSLGQEILCEFQQRRATHVLMVGASAINRQMVPLLTAKPGITLTITNRSDQSAQQMARDLGLSFAPWESLPHWPTFDAVIVATRASHYLLHDCSLDQPTVLFDLAVPRNIDPKLGQRSGVTLFNIDHLNHRLGSGHLAVQHSFHQAVEEVRTRVGLLFARYQSRLEAQREWQSCA